jgi:hypothetical protein
MLHIELKGMDELIKKIKSLRERELPFITMQALNNTAFEVRQKEIDLINKVFDRPKPQTAKNIFVRKATKTNLQAIIFFDQIYGKDGIDEYMKAQIHGGGRVMKAAEKRLGRYYVPALNANATMNRPILDKYGNIRPGLMTQILSQLQKFGDVAGYDMNQTMSSKLRARGKKRGTEYFMVSQKTGGLQPGIYQRISQGGGGAGRQAPWGARQAGQRRGKFVSVIKARGVRPVVFFAKSQPKYKARWPFFKEAEAIVNAKLPQYFEAAAKVALGNLMI